MQRKYEQISGDMLRQVFESGEFSGRVARAIKNTRRRGREHSFSLNRKFSGKDRFGRIVCGSNGFVNLLVLRDSHYYPLVLFHTHPNDSFLLQSARDLLCLEEIMLNWQNRRAIFAKTILCSGKYHYIRELRRYGAEVMLAQRLKPASQSSASRMKLFSGWESNGSDDLQKERQFLKYVRSNYRIGAMVYLPDRNCGLRLWEYGTRAYPAHGPPIMLETFLRDFEWRTCRVQDE